MADTIIDARKHLTGHVARFRERGIDALPAVLQTPRTFQLLGVVQHAVGSLPVSVSASTVRARRRVIPVMERRDPQGLAAEVARRLASRSAVPP